MNAAQTTNEKTSSGMSKSSSSIIISNAALTNFRFDAILIRRHTVRLTTVTGSWNIVISSSRRYKSNRPYET